MTRITSRPAVAPVSTASTSAAQKTEASAPAENAGWKPVAGAARVAPTTPAMTSEQVATAFYEAFSKRDVAAMGALYAPNAKFDDPIYDLKGRDETTKMWGTLFKTGKNLEVKFKVLESGPDGAKVSWNADYEVFGRKVHNECVANLTIKDGKITAHRDEWSWSKWARQALPLGPLAELRPVRALVNFFLQRA
jgi:ketosteroid isomerase-like protein